MILSRNLLAQDSGKVEVSKSVLKYLYGQSVKAKHLDKAMQINEDIILSQMEVIDYKDSLLINCDEKNDLD